MVKNVLGFNGAEDSDFIDFDKLFNHSDDFDSVIDYDTPCT